MDRFFTGIQKVNIQNLQFTKDDIREIITKAVAKSGCRNCSYRYYLSAGVSAKEQTPLFYVLVEDGIPVKPLEGCKDL